MQVFAILKAQRRGEGRNLRPMADFLPNIFDKVVFYYFKLYGLFETCGLE